MQVCFICSYRYDLKIKALFFITTSYTVFTECITVRLSIKGMLSFLFHKPDHFLVWFFMWKSEKTNTIIKHQIIHSQFDKHEGYTYRPHYMTLEMITPHQIISLFNL